MALETEDLARVAELARLRIDDDDLPEVTGRLDRILGMVEQLQGVNTEGVEPMANPMDATQRLRADVVTESDQREAFQAIAPATENGLYLVPKVID
jgi:aspartyl-tRNA(Asn)/glutamyl-tRNA(Gln) amidotransferase subunit C